MNMVNMKDVGSDSDYAMPTAMDCCPCIYLSTEQTEALGIKGMPAPGTVFMLQARAVVTSMTATAEESDEVAKEGAAPDISVSLKLVEMGVSPQSTSDTERASVLYGA